MTNRLDTSVSLQTILTHTFHGDRVVNAAKAVDVKNGKFPKKLRGALAAYLNEMDKPYQIQGIDFSRTQLDILMAARDAGEPIEFETLGPYLADYVAFDGIMKQSNLIPEDRIGLHLATVIRQFFPTARLISLYDDHNTQKGMGREYETPVGFDDQLVRNFKQSLIDILKQVDVVGKGIEGEDFLLIPESSKVIDAERLIKRLEHRGFITRQGDEIAFVNEDAENPLYRRIVLRNKQGRWLCEALDAAGFLKLENRRITHIVALPSYMKSQQDKVWEVLRALDIPLGNYHNIFYDPTIDPQTAARVVAKAFQLAEALVAA